MRIELAAQRSETLPVRIESGEIPCLQSMPLAPVRAAIEAAEKAKTVSEDEATSVKERIQKVTKKHEDEIDSIVTAKTKEIEEV